MTKETKNTPVQPEEIDKRFLWPNRDFLVKCPAGKHEILIREILPKIFTISTSPWTYQSRFVIGTTLISFGEIFLKGTVVEVKCPHCPPKKGRFAIKCWEEPKLP